MRGGRGKRASASKVLQVDPVAASDMQSGSLQSGSGSQCVEIAASSTGADAYKQSSSGAQSVETAASLSDQVSESDTQSISGEKCSSKAKKSRLMMRSDLTAEDEESMVEWLRENPQMYNKKLSTYKDKGKKDALWAKQAQVLGKDASMLIVWYRSIRTRFGKLTKPKSGAGTGDRTDRDKRILTNFEFLKPHIHEVQSRTIVSVRSFFIF